MFAFGTHAKNHKRKIKSNLPGRHIIMTTRRNFLKGAAGIVFCSCGMLDAVHAQAGGRRLPVRVKGKRIKTIDVHSHCLFHESLALMGDEASNVIPKTKGAEEHFIR
jgi:aminocarboxymuconate-semialdehyde decarboxylase